MMIQPGMSKIIIGASRVKHLFSGLKCLKRRVFRGAFIIVLMAEFFSYSYGQSPFYLIFDSNQSQRFGAENIITVQELLCSGQNVYIPHKITNDSTFLKKSMNIGFRLAKSILLESQIDYLFMLSQHEIVGHGSSFRELGYSRISYNLNLPPPLGNGSGFTSGRRPTSRIITKTEEIRTTISGNEANILMSDLLTQRFIFNDNLPYRKAQLYLFSKNNLLTYIWIDRFSQGGTFGGGDIADYVSMINSQNPMSEKKYTLEKLSRQSLISLVNPIQLYSLVSIGNYLLKGDEEISRLPALQIKNLRYLPALGFNLTPFGSEVVINQYFFTEEKLFQFSLHIGDNTYHDFWGLGLRVQNLISCKNFQLNNDIKFWNQPAFELGGNRINHIDNGSGFFISTDCSYYPFKYEQKFGLFAQIGYKTRGYVSGEQLSNGFIFRFGVALRQIKN